MKQVQMAKVICFGTYRILRKTELNGDYDYKVTYTYYESGKGKRTRTLNHFTTYSEAINYLAYLIEDKCI